MATVFQKCRLCPGSSQRLSSGTPGRVPADTLPVGLVVCKLNLTVSWPVSLELRSSEKSPRLA